MAHCPSLGCMGLCEKDSFVYCTKINTAKCDYKVCLAHIITKGEKVNIGIAPKMAEKIAY